MTINDIRNEGWTVMNTVALVTDVASIVIPVVPAGVSHALRAAKYANKAVNAVDTAADAAKAAKRLGDISDIYKTAVHNTKSKVAVLGAWTEDMMSYEKVGEKFKNTYLHIADYEGFIKKYGKDAFKEHINIPFIQKEIIEKKKTVLFTTPIEEIKKMNPAKRLLRLEYEMLFAAGYKIVNNRMMVPR